MVGENQNVRTKFCANVLSTDTWQKSDCLGRLSYHPVYIICHHGINHAGPQHMKKFATDVSVIGKFKEAALSRSSIPGIVC